MKKIIEEIQNVGQSGIKEILDAAVGRYQELYPDWQITIFSLEKAADKNDQLDRMIVLLQNMKEK